jgi:polygalacturonase
MHKAVHFLLRFLSLGIVSASGMWALDARSFGAAGNGISNDTAPVQNAINACPNGGTVTFSAGNYLVSGLFLKSNCTYAGSGNATVTLASANQFILDIS